MNAEASRIFPGTSSALIEGIVSLASATPSHDDRGLDVGTELLDKPGPIRDWGA